MGEAPHSWFRLSARSGVHSLARVSGVSNSSDSVSDYDYSYPPEAVAQEPAAQRDAARLLAVTPAAAVTPASAVAPTASVTPIGESAIWHDGCVRDLPSLLRAGDLLVLNEVRVRAARVEGTRLSTGGRVSALVLAERGAQAELLIGTRGRLQSGEELRLGGARWRLEHSLGEGRWDARLLDAGEVSDLLSERGRMPLPPYIERARDADPRDAADRERYQTAFGDGTRAPRGAAAPTAGLHFTPELLARLESVGVPHARLELEVGVGTFRPLRGESLDEHDMHEERYTIPESLLAAYAACRARGGRVVAVGTTVVRALESAVRDDGRRLEAGSAATRLFLRPGARFAAVDALLTNFHQPRSSLLVLVSAFAGRETIRHAYTSALERGYRFFSYGDAMLLAAR
ncbi:MAG: S-adenosylmethionine:tRNA ribosyltransferase-isomerase [Planctomycetota bacterium]|nr:MAG: S-adenosylmethionine:tRNA ribosyltransferase-isomerase [Planctomycetota bacterium]